MATALPYGGPALCTLLQPPTAAQTMASCSDHSAPVTPDRPPCDLAQCGTPSIAVPLVPLVLPLAFSVVDVSQAPASDGFAGDRRPPLTPPPIA